MKLETTACQAAPANRIYMIDVLKDDELQTGLSKYEKFRDEVLSKIPGQANFIKKKIFHKKCSDLKSIESVFSEIKIECNSSTFPLIFFDGHGDKEKGLKLSNGEFVDWKSFNRHLEEITHAAHGNLTVVASFCHSMTAFEMPDFNKPPSCPFYYGYSDEVFAGDIEAESMLLIESLIQYGGVNPSNRKMEFYSEYIHALKLISPFLLKFIHPQENASIFPDLSKNKLRKSIQSEIAKDFGKIIGLNYFLSEVLDISWIVRCVVKGAMHNTNRRDILISEILKQIEKYK